jgi:hypothetical protein
VIADGHLVPGPIVHDIPGRITNVLAGGSLVADNDHDVVGNLDAMQYAVVDGRSLAAAAK